MTHPPDVVDNEGARKAGWTLWPESDTEPRWETVCKAVYADEDEQVAHVTKRLQVPGGWLYEVATTRYGKEVLSGDLKHPGDRPYHHTKAVAFVPWDNPVTQDELMELAVKGYFNSK